MLWCQQLIFAGNKLSAPDWVPVVGGQPVYAWLDFRSQQYWIDPNVYGSLSSLLIDVNGQAVSITPGRGVVPFGSPTGSGILSSQTIVDPLPNPPPFTVLPPTDLMNALNFLLNNRGGVTVIAGVIHQGGNGNPTFVYFGYPWFNPDPGIHITEFSMQMNDQPFPNNSLVGSVEQLTGSFIYTTGQIGSYGESQILNCQSTLVNSPPTVTFSMNGAAAIGPISLFQAFNAEGNVQWLYVGNDPHTKNGSPNLGVAPIGAMQYLAFLNPTSLPLVNFPDAFIPQPPVNTPKSQPTIIVKLPGSPPDPYP